MNDSLDNSTDRQPRNRHWNLVPLAVFLIVVAGLLVCLGLLAYLARDLLIILFLSVLFAIFLTKLAEVTASYSPIPYKASVGIVVTLLLGLAFGSLFFFGTKLKTELTMAAEHIDEARAELRNELDEHPALGTLLNEAPVVRTWVNAVTGQSSSGTDSESKQNKESGSTKDRDPQPSTASATDVISKPLGDNASSHSTDQPTSAYAPDKTKSSNSSQDESKLSQAVGAVKSVAGSVLAAVSGMIRTTFGLTLNILIIFFVGLFVALHPAKTRDGIAQLAVPASRDEVRRVMNCLGDSLWSWLIGRFATMTVTGTSVGIGLWFLGVPMPITLGVVTGLLTFVPNIGGLLALSLAMFMALPSGLSTVAWVVGLYIAFQLVESYIITPLIQQYQVDIPPALLIGTQALFGFLLGFLGAMVASPALVLVLVLHDEVYQKHIHRWQKSS